MGQGVGVLPHIGNFLTKLWIYYKHSAWVNTAEKPTSRGCDLGQPFGPWVSLAL